jgi:hypothetical protein
MDEELENLEIKVSVSASVAMIADQLTIFELLALNTVAQTDLEPLLGWSFDYDVVKPLFTKNGTRMNKETKEALEKIVIQRLITSKEDC